MSDVAFLPLETGMDRLSRNRPRRFVSPRCPLLAAGVAVALALSAVTAIALTAAQAPGEVHLLAGAGSSTPPSDQSLASKLLALAETQRLGLLTKAEASEAKQALLSQFVGAPAATEPKQALLSQFVGAPAATEPAAAGGAVNFDKSAGAAADEPNPPRWPSSVRVFAPGDTDIQATVNAAFAVNGGHDPPNHGEFSDVRFAFLFKPGEYTEDVPVGYYTQVVGLGATPDDVVFTGAKGVFCEEGSYDFTSGALTTFWRAAENFRSKATNTWWKGAAGMLWAVSQAAPLRRIHVDGNLYLWQYTNGPAAGFASGGFLANAQLDGDLSFGSQQQFLTRNARVRGTVPEGVWNMVFVGVEGAPANHCGRGSDGADKPFVTVDRTPIVAEKPYLTIDAATGRYTLVRPAARSDTTGPAFSFDAASDAAIPFSRVYVADAAIDTAASINAKLDAGKHVVLAPGIFDLDAPLRLTHAGQCLLGLGLATLRASNGTAAVVVGDVDGVRVAGVLIEAGATDPAGGALLTWGTSAPADGGRGHVDNPGVLSDVFVRVGGPRAAETNAATMVHVRRGHVVGDNVWLWRADHDVGGLVKASKNKCNHALVVDGDDATFYGLAAEHTLKDLVVWRGERGATYFYQSELPYDVTQETFGDMGYVGYRVVEGVQEHVAFGAGVYTFFRDHPVTVATGISVPEAVESSFVAPLGVFLNGLGTLSHVLNKHGNATSLGMNGKPAYVC